MSTLLSTISETNLKIRWEEPYVSEALNKVVGSLPSGIVHGFIPTAGGGLILSLGVNTAMGYSAMRVRDTADGLAVLYLADAALSLDLTAHIGTTIYIGVVVDYDVGVATTGQVRAYSAGEFAAGVTDAIWVCGVAVPGVGALANADIDTSVATRSEDDAGVSAWGALSVAENEQDVPNLVSAGFYSAATATTTIQAIAGSEVGNAYRTLWISGTPTPVSALAIAPVTAAERVVFSWKHKLVAASGTIVGVFVQWLNKDFGVISTEWVGVAAAAATVDWTAYTRSRIAPALSVWVQVSIGVQAMTAGTVYHDRVVIRYENSGTRRHRRALVSRASLNLAVLGKDPMKFGSMFYDSDTDRFYITASTGTIYVPTALHLTSSFTLNAAKHTKRWAGFGLKNFVDFEDITLWAPAATGLLRVHATASTTIHIPLEDLPIGAVITEFGIAAEPQVTDVAAVLSITLKKAVYAAHALTVTTKGTDTVTGSTAMTGVTHTVTNTDGAGSDETRANTDDYYYLEIVVDNGNTASNWLLLKVWVNWTLDLQTPATY